MSVSVCTNAVLSNSKREQSTDVVLQDWSLKVNMWPCHRCFSVILQVDVSLFSQRRDVTVIRHVVIRMSIHRTNINICGIYTQVFKKRVCKKAFTASVKKFSHLSPGWSRESRNVTGFWRRLCRVAQWSVFSLLCQLKQGTGIVYKTFSFQGNWNSRQLSEHKHERYACTIVRNV